MKRITGEKQPAENVQNAKRLKGFEAMELFGFKFYGKSSAGKTPLDAATSRCSFRYQERESFLGFGNDEFLGVTETPIGLATVDDMINFVKRSSSSQRARKQIKIPYVQIPEKIRNNVVAACSSAAAPATAPETAALAKQAPLVLEIPAAENILQDASEVSSAFFVDELRRKSISDLSGRRKSLALKDTRKSALLSLTASKTYPPDVATSDWYLHLDTTLPGAVRMQLLVCWALSFAAATKLIPITETQQEALCALQQKFCSRQINTSWYLREHSDFSEQEESPVILEERRLCADRKKIDEIYSETLHGISAISQRPLEVPTAIEAELAELEEEAAKCEKIHFECTVLHQQAEKVIRNSCYDAGYLSQFFELARENRRLLNTVINNRYVSKKHSNAKNMAFLVKQLGESCPSRILFPTAVEPSTGKQ